MKEAPYYVWRRNDDGYVAATRYIPPRDKFTILGTFDSWTAAANLIQVLKNENNCI